MQMAEWLGVQSWLLHRAGDSGLRRGIQEWVTHLCWVRTIAAGREGGIPLHPSLGMKKLRTSVHEVLKCFRDNVDLFPATSSP